MRNDDYDPYDDEQDTYDERDFGPDDEDDFSYDSLDIRRLMLVGLFSFLAVALGVAVWFFSYFHVKNIQFQGNTLYAEEEIRERFLKGPFAANSILAPIFCSKQNVEDMASVDTVSVSRIDNSTIIVSVLEKKPVGYIHFLDEYIYFDRTGLFLDSSHETSDRYPYVTGVDIGRVVEGEKLDFKGTSILATTAALSAIFTREGLTPRILDFDDKGYITLKYDNIQVNLGRADFLEDKMARAIAIMKVLAEKEEVGILHLEGVTDNVKTITFEETEITYTYDTWPGGYEEDGTHTGTGEYTAKGRYVGPRPTPEWEYAQKAWLGGYDLDGDYTGTGPYARDGTYIGPYPSQEIFMQNGSWTGGYRQDGGYDGTSPYDRQGGYVGEKPVQDILPIIPAGEESGNEAGGDALLEAPDASEGGAKQETGGEAAGQAALPEGAVLLPEGTGLSADGASSSSNGTVFSPDGTGFSSNGTGFSSNGTGFSSNGTGSSWNGTEASSDGPGLSSDGTGSSSNGLELSSEGTGLSSGGAGLSTDGSVSLPDGIVSLQEEAGSLPRFSGNTWSTEEIGIRTDGRSSGTGENPGGSVMSSSGSEETASTGNWYDSPSSDDSDKWYYGIVEDVAGNGSASGGYGNETGVTPWGDGYNYGGYQQEDSYDHGAYQWEDSYDYGTDQWEDSYDYGAYQWEDSYDYGAYQWDDSYDYGGGQWDDGYDYDYGQWDSQDTYGSYDYSGYGAW